MAKSSTLSAGIDTGKRKLDVALAGRPERLRVDNTAAGHAELAAWLDQHRVRRVGIEASGGYEAAVVAHLRGARCTVILFQPAQVRAYAMFHLQRAKNDTIDATLIADCTAACRRVHPAPDPRLAPFAAQLTLIEQLGEDIACCKTRRETCADARIRRHWQDEIARLKARLRGELAALVAAVRIYPDLAARLALIGSIAGIGLRTAVAILIRMPEIGRLSRGEAAALGGLAPYDDDSGEREGARHIGGGRKRLRKSLYSAALSAAFHWNPPLMALYRRLIAAGKPHKVALVACARKLLIYANAVVERGTPWRSSAAAVAEPNQFLCST